MNTQSLIFQSLDNMRWFIVIFGLSCFIMGGIAGVIIQSTRELNRTMRERELESLR